ncbi:MAG TPA: site-2 protease family protein [Cyclobacteriaceae bacterium]|nr:site-2 protease family protein [Cyclobacteriaceae bacterium]
MATLVTTTIAGAEWTYGKSIWISGYTFDDFLSGLHFSIPFLLVLTTHEFGHYFTAKYHQVKSTLPYYIPLPPFPFSIGTMGAVIRLQQRVISKTQNFDIGISGPIAGFVVAIALLVYGFTHLPEPEYIFQIHPEYEQYGLNYAEHVYADQENVIDIVIGQNLLFIFFENFLADPERMPNPHELIHYPFLFSGFLALFFTSLNLLPIGQLDGGHVVYGLFGSRGHKTIASIFFILLVFYAGLGTVTLALGDDLLWAIPLYIVFLYITLSGMKLRSMDRMMYAVFIFAAQFLLSWLLPEVKGFSGWLLFAFVVGRFLGVRHPGTLIEEPLDQKRKILGWIALIIFLICFTPMPIQFIGE